MARDLSNPLAAPLAGMFVVTITILPL